mgnify:CR=1 FL=1
MKRGASEQSPTIHHVRSFHLLSKNIFSSNIKCHTKLLLVVFIVNKSGVKMEYLPYEMFTCVTKFTGKKESALHKRIVSFLWKVVFSVEVEVLITRKKLDIEMV